MLVVQTYAVPHKDRRKEVHHYEVHLVTETAKFTPVLVLTTQDRGLYEQCLAREGQPQRVTAHYHRVSGNPLRGELDGLDL